MGAGATLLAGLTLRTGPAPSADARLLLWTGILTVALAADDLLSIHETGRLGRWTSASARRWSSRRSCSEP
jgi:hypothetical protein